MPHRAFATLGQRDSESFGSRATCMVFKRPALTKHMNFFSVGDQVVPNDTIVEEERLYLTLAIGDRSALPSELRTQFMTHPNGPPGRQVCLPEGTDLQSLEGGVFVSADMTASFYHNNALAVIRSNFTDVKDAREYTEGPASATAPLEAAVYVRDFLDRAFPEKGRILFSDGKLIETFDAQKKSLNNGEEIRLQISFGLEALRMTEIVRLRATSGSFRRQGADVFYKAAQPGKQTITLEAISGTHWDGKVDYAEQRQLEITVE